MDIPVTMGEFYPAKLDKAFVGRRMKLFYRVINEKKKHYTHHVRDVALKTCD